MRWSCVLHSFVASAAQELTVHVQCVHWWQQLQWGAMRERMKGKEEESAVQCGVERCVHVGAFGGSAQRGCHWGAWARKGGSPAWDGRRLACPHVMLGAWAGEGMRQRSMGKNQQSRCHDRRDQDQRAR